MRIVSSSIEQIRPGNPRSKWKITLFDEFGKPHRFVKISSGRNFYTEAAAQVVNEEIKEKHYPEPVVSDWVYSSGNWGRKYQYILSTPHGTFEVRRPDDEPWKYQLVSISGTDVAAKLVFDDGEISVVGKVLEEHEKWVETIIYTGSDLSDPDIEKILVLFNTDTKVGYRGHIPYVPNMVLEDITEEVSDNLEWVSEKVQDFYPEAGEVSIVKAYGIPSSSFESIYSQSAEYIASIGMDSGNYYIHSSEVEDCSVFEDAAGNKYGFFLPIM